MKLLNTYANASGQKINLTKSEVFFSQNIRNLEKEDLTSIMRVRHVTGTRKYLGLPSMIGRSKKEKFLFYQRPCLEENKFLERSVIIKNRERSHDKIGPLTNFVINNEYLYPPGHNV